MKKILFLLLLFPLSLRANILISTACSEGGSTTWTIGEIMVATLSDNNSEKSLTQGFLHSNNNLPESRQRKSFCQNRRTFHMVNI